VQVNWPALKVALPTADGVTVSAFDPDPTLIVQFVAKGNNWVESGKVV